MKKSIKQKMTLDQPFHYQIKVSGALDERWFDWDGEMAVKFECNDESMPVSTLTGFLDQAALQGLLRRLYSLGIPLVSVICLDFVENEQSSAHPSTLY